jgi:hypothetical protein
LIKTMLLCASLVSIGLAGCVSVPDASAPAKDREVVAYVTQNWDAYSARAAYLAGRPRAGSALLEVEDVQCQAQESRLACTFTTRVRLADGVEAAPTVESIFGREPDGSLVQLIQVQYAPG